MEKPPILHRLPSLQVYHILQQVYQALPEVMERIAPQGWQNSTYHRHMMQDRWEIHQDFIQDLPKDQQPASDTAYLEAGDDNPFTLENYFCCTFPPMNNYPMEIFYIIASHLMDITSGSVLLGTETSKIYYIAEDTVHEALFEIAYEHQEIDDMVRDMHACILTAPPLQGIDAIYAYECLFAILHQMGYHLRYLDTDLLYIAELQEIYQDIHYTDITSTEKTEKIQQIQSDIQYVINSKIPRSYRQHIDLFDLEAIVRLLNTYKVDPVVLSYLHIYDAFPRGYPCVASDYCDEDEQWD